MLPSQVLLVLHHHPVEDQLLAGPLPPQQLLHLKPQLQGHSAALKV